MAKRLAPVLLCDLCSAPVTGKIGWRKHWAARHLDISGYIPSYTVQASRIIPDPLTKPGPGGSLKKRPTAKSDKGE